jgi:hypothetical protein
LVVIEEWKVKKDYLCTGSLLFKIMLSHVFSRLLNVAVMTSLLITPVAVSVAEVRVKADIN